MINFGGRTKERITRVYSFFLPPKLIMSSIEGEESLGTRLSWLNVKMCMQVVVFPESPTD